MGIVFININSNSKLRGMTKIKTGSDFSGVGAFDYAIERVSESKVFEHERVFACDMDKFARKAYIANHGKPEYYPENVYDRQISEESLDVYMTSPPCQSFSLAGNRQGKKDERGVLFFNSHEFIQKNKPRYFIFENVKGLLSDDEGRTFSEWVNMLGGKSINGLPVLFPYENSAPYHIYWKVMNAKNYGVPQNRERVFIIGIRDDSDNSFQWPKEIHLKQRLKDVLKSEVDPKYFLSEKAVNRLCFNDSGFTSDVKNENDIASTLRAVDYKISRGMNCIKIVGNTNPSGNGMNGNVFDSQGIAPTLSTNKGEGIKIGTWRTHEDGKGFRSTSDNTCPTIPARAREDGSGQPVICIPVLTLDRPNKRQNGRRFKEDGDPSFTITTQDRHGIFDGYDIRRLIPLECFRLMDFPDEHVQRSREAGISDSQLYKQAGNSIVVKCLELILEKLNFS